MDTALFARARRRLDIGRVAPSIAIESRVKSPISRKNYGLMFQANYSHTSRSQFRGERIEYTGRTPSWLEWDQHSPRHNYEYKLRLSRNLLYLKRKNLNITSEFSYFYIQSYSRDARTRMELEDTVPSSAALLPSTTADANWQVDQLNTYLTGEFKRNHLLRPQFSLRFKKATIRLLANYNFSHRRLLDQRAGNDQHITRRDQTFSTSVTLNVGKLRTFYSYTQFLPPMSQLMAVRDASDWQNVFLGNPDLKKSVQHTVGLSYNRSWTKRARWFNISLQGNLNDKAIGQERTYDATTGIYTTKPRNVDGSWNTSLNTGYGQQLGKARRLSLSTGAWGSIRRSVDFSWVAQTTGSGSSVRSKVYNYNAGAEASLTYRTQGGIHVGAKGRLDHTRQTARPVAYYRTAFTNYSYGLTLTLPLTAKLGLETDAMAYARSGYADRTMNGTDFVWNASLSFTPDRKKQWLLRAVAFDILHELKTVQRTVNDQGYTETWYNTIPSYITLHAVYRINVKPKKH